VSPAGGGGKVERLTSGNQVVYALSDPTADAKMSVLVSTDSTPAEVYAFEGGKLRKLSHQNDEWLSGVQLAQRVDLTSKSKDGTEVHSIITRPLGFRAGVKYPTLLRIHGGPDAQEDHSWMFEHQLFAANGYLVLAVNYRGGSGRGEKYQTSIYGDWGHLEVVDLLGAVDAVVAAGMADSQRLGIGGWSYGGILTDYTIASDTRFKGAISGAGSALQLSMYGVDQYTIQYETEIGAPWKNPDQWIKISYPFFHADRIKTPTLFLVGERDFNVPAVGSEQMYQALRSLGVPTELVIYPGQFHGITIPSYKIDRLNRYLSWYEKWVKTGQGGGVRAGSGS
jgi:dipeptidyl aminopeptidase/acylaminoacyl peptidase